MTEPLIFDAENALKRVDGDRELYSELVNIFFEEYSQMLENIREARRKGDGKKVQEVAHSMKSALGNLGAMRAFGLAQVMESNGTHGRIEMIDGNLKTLEEEVAKYKQLAEEFVKGGVA